MSGRIIKLGPGECVNAETGARYFAALAFPGINEDQARADAVRAWAGLHFAAAMKAGNNDLLADDRVHQFRDLPVRWCRAKLRTAPRRLRDRSLAAKAVRPWVHELLGSRHRPVAGIRKFTQQQVALHLCAGDPEWAKNFRTRKWQPSRPALHLAIAYDLAMSTLGPDEIHLAIELDQVTLFRELVAAANRAAPMICHDHRFGVGAEDLLCLEWVD